MYWIYIVRTSQLLLYGDILPVIGYKFKAYIDPLKTKLILLLKYTVRAAQ
jgi:hypothetical protein